MDDNEYQYSDEEIDETKHEKIIENVLNLDKSKKLKKPLRTEPALKISEFNLVKSLTGRPGSVKLDQLAKVLKKQKKHSKIAKTLETTKVKARTLAKRLERPQREQVKRVLTYEKTRFKFDRWDAYVQANRSAPHQVFPLDSDKVDKSESNDFTSNWTYKSELQKKLDELKTPVEEYHVPEADQEEVKQKVTLQELKEIRQETAKLRARQSYREAKARRQNKIKSKKYHRILRKEKIRAKIKEFDELQKTNPEEALKKLDEIEKARALERFSLRHKGTGQWAKNKQIRAKYDRETRQVLAEQLKISRDLTQKIQPSIETSDDEQSDKENNVLDTNETNLVDESNPWTGRIKPHKEVSEFLSDYKKFWAEKIKEKAENEMECEEPISSNIKSKKSKIGAGNTKKSKISTKKSKTDSNNFKIETKKSKKKSKENEKHEKNTSKLKVQEDSLKQKKKLKTIEKKKQEKLKVKKCKKESKNNKRKVDKKLNNN